MSAEATHGVHTEEEELHHSQVEGLRRRLRPICLVLGLAGGVLGAMAALTALDVADLGTLFVWNGRTGTGVGITALVMALISVAGAVLVLKVPSGASALMYIGGCGGFLAIGSLWVLPGILILVSANLALWAIPDPLWVLPPLRRQRATGGGTT